MADKNDYTSMSWFKRAIDKSTPTTEANETIRTSSFEQDGKIYLVPTMRIIDGKLTRLMILYNMHLIRVIF